MNNVAKLQTLIKSILKEIYPIGSYVRMAKVINSYNTEDKYVCDIQVLKNDGTEDENFPQINSVDIPVLWAGDKKGIICPPTKDTICDVYFYGGDLNFPVISNFRQNSSIPISQLDELIIQQNEDTFIKISKDNNIEVSCKSYSIKANENGDITIKKALNIIVNDKVNIECKNATIKAENEATIEGSKINIGQSASMGVIHTGILSWLDSHTHTCSAPGTPSSPPTPPASSMLSAISSSSVKVSS